LGGDNTRVFRGRIIDRKLFHQMILAEELEKRQVELERQLMQTQEERIRSLTEKIGKGLNNLDFGGKQELFRLLVGKVIYDGQTVEIQTIIPIGQQLYPLHQGD